MNSRRRRVSTHVLTIFHSSALYHVFDKVKIQMIKLIAIIDSVRGMVDNPPEELMAIVQDKISKSGRVTLYTALSDLSSVKTVIDTANELPTSVWLLGNDVELQMALPYAKELYIIQMDGIFESSQTFPHFEEDFYMVKRKPIQRVNGIQYQCQIWRPDLANFKDSWDFDIREDV